MLNTVSVPEQFGQLFQKAQEYVSRYFSLKKEDPSRGTIEIFGERYILVRAASMSVDFFDTIRNLFSSVGEDEAINIARSMLFDIAHTVGKMDARNFHKKMNLNDPIEKLSAGPVHFSHSGWAFVDILPESNPSPDKEYCLVYDHPFSFESDAWVRAGRKSELPVCVMNAGYSSGWCEESFGVSLVASEITCKAKGDEECRFIMAHPSRIERYIQEYLDRVPEIARKVTTYQIPGLFERKWMEERLRESEANYLTIFNEANDAIFVHDLDTGGILDVNKRMCELFGYTREEALSLDVGAISSCKPPYRLQDAVRLIHKTIEQGPQVFEWHARHKSGRMFWIEVNLKCAKIMGEDRVLAVVRDITQRKQAEEEMEKLNRDLQVANTKLTRTNEELQEFAYITAHDLKTPLRGIGTLADWISTDYADKFDEQGREQIDMLVTKAKQMDALISSILGYCRLGRTDEEKLEVDFNAVVREVIDEIAAPENIEITIANELPRLRCERTHVIQVFQNLLSNAVKYMDKPEGKISVACLEWDDCWRFSVTDNGPGIDEKYFEKIFKIFQTLGPREGVENTGIGLSIVKKVAERNGGRVWVESKLGCGSAFFFELPKALSVGIRQSSSS